MSDFGATLTSNATLNSISTDIPVSSAYVPNTGGAVMTPVEGIAINTDASGKKSTAFRIGLLNGDNETLGHKADAKSTKTDTTAVTIMAVLKQISFMAQNPASTPVTGTFWQATQPVSGTVTANAGTGPFPVAGMVASGASNANNPEKGGGVFNTTQPTVTSCQVVHSQYTAL